MLLKKLDVGVKNTPEVPRDTKDCFCSTTPRPTADAALSPAPPTTITLLLNLKRVVTKNFN